MREVLLKHAVHLLEVRHVVEEHVDLNTTHVSMCTYTSKVLNLVYIRTHLDDAVNTDTSLLENSNDVLAALCRLVCDAALDQGTGLVSGDLARDEDLRAGDDSLALIMRQRYVQVLECTLDVSWRGSEEQMPASGMAES